MKYKFRVKCIDLQSGGRNIVVLNMQDAKEIDVLSMDRITVSVRGKQLTGILDLTEHWVRKGELGVFGEVKKGLSLRNNDTVYLEPKDKPPSIHCIKRKMDGQTLSYQDIDMIIEDLMQDNFSDAELAAFISALYIRGLSTEETINLTKAIVASGTVLEFKKKPIMDKHSIGGVPGNRTTLLIVPIVASAGLTIPKTSSKSITSPAGTADTMEVLAPVALDEQKIMNVVRATNGCIAWGGGVNIAAADDKLIQVRRPLNLDPRGVLLASILAKKKAVSATHVLIDIPIGHGAKVYTKEEGQSLANDFMSLGTKLGMNVECIITPGYDPVGRAVGPALEARETLRILEGKDVSPDLKRKSVIMAGILLELGGKAKPGHGRVVAQHLLENGDALKKMHEIIRYQGGDGKIKSSDIKLGKKKITITSKQSGRIHYLNVKDISTIARAAGAPLNKGAGIYLYVEKGDKIKKGDNLFTIYAESQRKLKIAERLVAKLKPVELEKVILGKYRPKKSSSVYEIS